jgi:hypothetical protein
MKKAGKRQLLLIYEYTLGLWYPATFVLSERLKTTSRKCSILK